MLHMQVQFLLGRKGPAECLNLTEDPTKIYLVPRKGGKPIVSLPMPILFACNGLLTDLYLPVPNS